MNCSHINNLFRKQKLSLLVVNDENGEGINAIWFAVLNIRRAMQFPRGHLTPFRPKSYSDINQMIHKEMNQGGIMQIHRTTNENRNAWKVQWCNVAIDEQEMTWISSTNDGINSKANMMNIWNSNLVECEKFSEKSNWILRISLNAELKIIFDFLKWKWIWNTYISFLEVEVKSMKNSSMNSLNAEYIANWRRCLHHIESICIQIKVIVIFWKFNSAKMAFLLNINIPPQHCPKNEFNNKINTNPKDIFENIH